MRLWVLLREQDMRPKLVHCRTRECTPGLTSVKLPNSLHLSLSLSFKLELAEPSYRSAASHGLWGAARSVLQCIIFSPSMRERVTSAWPRALLWLSGTSLL